MSDICPSCGGRLGRECFNTGECAAITADMDAQARRSSPQPVQPGEEALGAFGHHPEAGIDFEIECEVIEGMAADAKAGVGSQWTFWGRLSRALKLARANDWFGCPRMDVFLGALEAEMSGRAPPPAQPSGGGGHDAAWNAGESLYRSAYYDGFADALFTEDEEEAHSRIDGVAVQDGWANHRDSFLAALSTPSLADTPGSDKGERGEPRFFIEHGMVHDRVTGRHVTTAPDDETWNGGTITDAVALLNSLSASPPPTPGREGLLAQIDALATKHFEASNEKRAPQWSRKAHAHAWAGVLEVRQLVLAGCPLPSDDREGLVADCAVIAKAIRSWRVPGFEDDEGCGMPLIDFLCAPKEKTVQEAIERVDDLVAHVAFALSPAGRDQAAGGGRS